MAERELPATDLVVKLAKRAARPARTQPVKPTPARQTSPADDISAKPAKPAKPAKATKATKAAASATREAGTLGKASAAAKVADTAAKAGAGASVVKAPAKPGRNTTQDRLLRHLLLDCRRLLSERGEANGPGIALAVVQQIEALNDEMRGRFFEHLARDFSPDPKQVLTAALAYAHAPADSAHLVRLTQAAEPPRQELFRRLNRAPGGTAAIVRLRRRLLERLPRSPALAGVEHDLLHLLGSWFNPGFLLMRKVDWDSPARLLEQIIRHEAVHEIDGWEDLRRRLRPDRPCASARSRG